MHLDRCVKMEARAIFPASLKTPKALVLLEAVTKDHTLLFALPGYEGKQTLRFYTGFKGHYTGAIVGAVWYALDDPLNDSDTVELSPFDLATRFNARTETIRRTLQRLCRGGWLAKIGRNTYRVTDKLRERIDGGAYQYINNDTFMDSPDETPRTLALKNAAETARTDTETARRFKVHRSNIARLRNRHRTQQTKPTQNATKTDTERTAKPTQNATKTDTERTRFKGCNKGIERLKDMRAHAHAKNERQKPLQERVRGVDETKDYLDRINRRGKYAEQP